MPSHRILVIEDNVETAQNIQLYLDHNNFHCDIEYSGFKGINRFNKSHYDLIILDRMLPDLTGVEVCQHIRKSSNVSIIMLTAKVSNDDLVDGLNAGADEYVKKPYSNKELVARIKSHLRRQDNSHRLGDNTDTQSIKIGNYNLNVESCTITSCGQSLLLTKTEYLIFEKLLHSPGRVFSREQLFLSAFDSSHESTDKTVDVHLHNLRAKIIKTGNNNHGIKSIYGMGFKLEIT